jgi:predicted RNA-binding Zn-ribbon protein involved in translation (DUF1610 family)
MNDYERESYEIERRVAAEATCEQCGHVGLSYRSEGKYPDRVAIARCPKCGHETEF